MKRTGFARSATAKDSAFASMTLTDAGKTVAKNVQPTAHWRSTYKNVVEEVDAAEKLKSRRPLWSINRQAYSSTRGKYVTEFADSFGNHGHVPRNLLPHDSLKQSNKNNELTVGTTKVTSHIPGYNGFIPQIDINERVIQQSKGEECRNTIIKQNIVENQSVRLPNY